MEKASNKLKVINKYFCFAWREYMENGKKVSQTKTIIPNPFELSKQYCVLQASGKKLELPHNGYSLWYEYEDDYPDFYKWCEAVYNKCFDIEAISKMDFSKPFDEEVVKAAMGKKPDKNNLKIDASDIIEAELSEE